MASFDWQAMVEVMLCLFLPQCLASGDFGFQLFGMLAFGMLLP